VLPRRPEVSFEDWVVNRFGWELYVTFFRSYTEKVWGMRCDQLSKDFAAQRIRGLSLWEVLRSAVSGGDSHAKSLITSFKYPRLGPGQLWETVRDDVVNHGGSIEMDTEVTRVCHDDNRVVAVVTADDRTFCGDHFYSTMPLSQLIRAIDPPPPPEVLAAANQLKFRDFLTVGLVVARTDVFTDNWIYVHSPEVSVGRIQNYGNWSAAMVADPSTSSLGMEYFCQQGDALWAMSDDDLKQLAVQELATIGFARTDECIDSVVIRVKDAYPVYGASYQGARETIKAYLNSHFVNLHPAGRGGLHNYNSQDHSMMAGLSQVRRVLDNRDDDVWLINAEQEYAELADTSG
jgi:protoporphyrinogen oxidase